MPCQNIIRPACGWVSFSQDTSPGSPLEVKNPARCHPLIQDKTSVCEIHLSMTGRFSYLIISSCFSQMGREKVTVATLSAESCIHSLTVVNMVLMSLGSPSMTGRMSICFASSAWILSLSSHSSWNVGTHDHGL